MMMINTWMQILSVWWYDSSAIQWNRYTDKYWPILFVRLFYPVHKSNIHQSTMHNLSFHFHYWLYMYQLGRRHKVQHSKHLPEHILLHIRNEFSKRHSTYCWDIHNLNTYSCRPQLVYTWQYSPSIQAWHWGLFSTPPPWPQSDRHLLFRAL